MIAKFARVATVSGLMLAVATLPLLAAEPSPGPTPSFSTVPIAAPTPVIDPGWAPAPGTAAFDPNAPKARPAPQASATASTVSVDGHHADGHRPGLSPGERLYELTRDASYLEPESWNVTAFKSRHELIVYYKGRMYRIYHAVFGRNREPGTKLWEGDRRTPEGVYSIIEKHRSRRWQWFLGLDYPNDADRHRYEQMRDAREVPVREGHDIGEGGHIGIHGTDIPILNSGNIDWTTGCISVNNQDIDELTRILPIGTVVIINP
jgi:lipoprotein-anchoring transpeptidase ErfK/SrfK